MGAVVKALTKEQYGFVCEVFDEDGVLLVTPDAFEELKRETQIPAEDLWDRLDGLSLPAYDYFGEPDVVFDIMRSTDHIAIDAIREQITDD